jgi:hypothetical protein
MKSGFLVALRSACGAFRPSGTFPATVCFLLTAGIHPHGGVTGRHADVSSLAGGLRVRHSAPGRPALKRSSERDPAVYGDIRGKPTIPGMGVFGRAHPSNRQSK